MHTHEQTPIDEMTFPELEALRAELGVSKSSVCRQSELCQGTYTRWMRWLRGEPKGCEPQPRSLKALRETLKRENARRARRAASAPGHLPA